MEKILNNLNFIILIFFTSFIFFWDVSFYNFQIKYLIVLLIFLFFQSKLCFKKIIDYKFLFFCLFFFHLLYNKNFNLTLYELMSFFYFIIVTIVIYSFKDLVIVSFEKIIFLFIIIFFLSLAFYVYQNYHFLNLTFITNFFQKSQFIFKENSHLGMVIPSVIIFLIYKFHEMNNYKYLFFIFILFFFVVIVYSLTVFVGLILSCLIIIFSNYSVIKIKTFVSLIFLIVASLTVIFSNSQLKNKTLNSQNYVFDILINNTNVSNIETQEKYLPENTIPNLSIEVYVKSFEIAFLSVKKNLFGYGFNNYHEAFNENISKLKIHDSLVKKLNSKDASNNLSKIISEFGLFAIIPLFFIFKFIYSKKIKLEYKFFLIPNLVTQTFLRGAGYFNGGYIFFLLLVFFLVVEEEL